MLNENDDLTFETVEQLIKWRKRSLVTPDPEYQRAAVWAPDQKKKLIDSVMRGYQLPVIYLHFRDNSSGKLANQSYHIVDGQQRINTLTEFFDGKFQLFTLEDKSARFPRFLLDKPCPWGGKVFDQLGQELKDRFLNTKIPVAIIDTEDENEVRDLFVRLQAGTPLNAQEKRDAYPGDFAEYILKLGGKEALGYDGHEFFKRVRNLGSKTDRGKARTFAAQIAMLFLERRNSESDRFIDHTSGYIDDYYYEHLDFDSNSAECQRLWGILDKLDTLLTGKPMIFQHEAIHLVLLLDTIWDDYTRSWEETLVPAHGAFATALVDARATRNDVEPAESWTQYGQFASGSTGRGSNVRQRHNYYSKRMIELMGNLVLKDPKRSYGPLERQVIYWRDGGRCQRPGCGASVDWNEAEIHHVVPHSQGGPTSLNNGSLVHSACHPKSRAETDYFEEHHGNL